MTTQARELAKLVNNSGDVNLVDDITLGSDGALLNFGADSDVVITHVADTGLLLNSSRQLQFGDSGTHIRQSADGVLQLTSDTEVEINATTIDINGNVDISGNLVLGGNITIGDADSDDISFGGELTSHIIPNADDTYDLGSSTKQWRNVYVDGTLEADAITVDGVSLAVVTSENVSDIVGAMFSSNTETNITVTYQDSDNTIDLVVDAAQPNVTSLGTLTALDVDNINLNGNTIKSTDSDGDIVFGGNDGGSAITALTLDMSDAGTAIFNNNIKVADAGVFIGAGDDLRLQHDGTDSFVTNYTGDLKFTQSVDDKDITFDCDDGSGGTERYITIDGSTKYIQFDQHTKVTDSNRIDFGNASDLQIYHDGTNSYLNNATGDLYIRTVNNLRITDTSNNKMILCQDGGETQLYHNGSEKLNTTANGVDVTGKVVCTTSARIGQVALTSSSNAVAWDSAAAANAYHVTTENTTFSAPSNAAEGAIISVEIAQGGTARTIAWNTVFEFAASTAPTITATANKTDILAFRYNGSVWQEIGRVQNMAQT